jgi:DNA primase
MDYRGRRDKGDYYSEEQVRRVLEGSGLNIYSELESDFVIFCPFHANFRTPAAEVNKESGLFFCFSCQESVDLIALVMHQTGRSYFESVRFIKSKEAASVDLENEISKKINSAPDYVLFDELLVKRLHTQAMDSDKAIRYFLGRGISKDSVAKFSLGYSDKNDMVTIPMHSPDGMLVGFVARSIEGKQFKNTPNMPKSKILFNLHRVKSSRVVYVVESSFDAIRLDQVGFPAVATLGANVSKKQLDLLQQYFNDVVVIADNDEAGGGMSSRICDRLGSRVSTVTIDSKYKDIGDMSDEEIKKLEYQFDKSILEMLS